MGIDIIDKTYVAFGHGEYSYPYCIGDHCMSALAAEVMALEPDRIVIVADETVWALHGNSIDCLHRAAVPVLVITLPAGEQAKRMDVLSRVLAQTLGWGVTRQSIVLTFGGGAAGNLGGLAASLLFRGIRLVHMPTTTIAAFDSVLSMKQAINSDAGKNQIGTYHQPSAVLVDVQWFDSLDSGVARGGWCEAAKNCLAIEPSAMGALASLALEPDRRRKWASLLEISSRAKSSVMMDDHFERRSGLILEYGHTVGHAIEYAAAVLHGDAVALGMIVAAEISQELSYLTAPAVEQHRTLLAELGAPARLPEGADVSQIISIVRQDNKRGLIGCDEDEIPMVLLERLGAPVISNGSLPLIPVPVALVETVLRRMS